MQCVRRMSCWVAETKLQTYFQQLSVIVHVTDHCHTIPYWKVSFPRKLEVGYKLKRTEATYWIWTRNITFHHTLENIFTKLHDARYVCLLMKYVLIDVIYLIPKPDFTRIVSHKINLLYMFDTESSGLNGVFLCSFALLFTRSSHLLLWAALNGYTHSLLIYLLSLS